jgi:hypothetical protein
LALRKTLHLYSAVGCGRLALGGSFFADYLKIERKKFLIFPKNVVGCAGFLT